MALKQEWLTTNGQGRAIRHRYIFHAETRSNRLMVLLPGWGYTSDMPLMYFLREAAFQAGWDTLSITYAFQTYPDADSGNLLDEVQMALDLPAIKDAPYKQLCTAGKSMGTPLAVELARQSTIPNISLILLTPIRNAHLQIGAIPTLAVIGTADDFYHPELTQNPVPNLTWRVFDGLNHSLQIPSEWKQSIEVLGQIIGLCADFLQQQTAT
jgi:hypothetical protein